VDEQSGQHKVDRRRCRAKMSLTSRKFGWSGSFFSDSCLFPVQVALSIYPQVPGTASWGAALRSLDAVRIGHGVRCLEDPELVAELRSRQIPLK